MRRFSVTSIDSDRPVHGSLNDIMTNDSSGTPVGRSASISAISSSGLRKRAFSNPNPLSRRIGKKRPARMLPDNSNDTTIGSQSSSFGRQSAALDEIIPKKLHNSSSVSSTSSGIFIQWLAFSQEEVNDLYAT
eukprot:TRINITY_DN7917_c0_g1_i2.p1 TRINITY_DN7917_c0_g1~~TRINITY_DN7917_c0_g1_i2.p1  ORF type:complete len:133 (-),score=29.40 TRINITY_DN7917_c0_g1_i2:470-868(-)